jgi:hypothetical protein
MREMAIYRQLAAISTHCLPNPEASVRMVSVKDTNPLIAEDFNAGRAALNERLGARECAMNVLQFVGHLLISTFGVGVAAAVLTYSVVLPLHQVFPSLSSRTVHWILTETPYFPVQIVVGLLWGFQLGRRYRHRVMLWTWVVPALAIAFFILVVPLPPVLISGVEITKTEHFFGRECLPQNHCFEWVLTLLLYAAAAYSLGAFVARRLAHRVSKRN